MPAAAKSSASESPTGASARKRPVFRERSHTAKKIAYTSTSQPEKSGFRTYTFAHGSRERKPDTA